jgi:alkanesulfonate monooxygenase SsuD/methylene tetrahydromethanopterin reductase-like flavin-dependent oxidoreductase (luciferase family)
MLGVSAVAADTDERARWLAAPGSLAFLRLRSGRPGLYPTAEEAAAYNFTPAEKEFVKGWTKSHMIGAPETVVEGIHDLVARTGADELMITTMVSDHKDRIRSYELIAELAGLTPPTS